MGSFSPLTHYAFLCDPYDLFSQPCGSVGGHLSKFVSNWQQATDNAYVIQTISTGLKSCSSWTGLRGWDGKHDTQGAKCAFSPIHVDGSPPRDRDSDRPTSMLRPPILLISKTYPFTRAMY